MAPNSRLGCGGAYRLLRRLCAPADERPLLLTGYAAYGTYEGIAMQLAVTAGALITTPTPPVSTKRSMRHGPRASRASANWHSGFAL